LARAWQEARLKSEREHVTPYISKHPELFRLGSVKHAEDLQKWLNTFDGIFVKVDGVPGDRTSNAFKKVTGVYLPGDPRA
jgi:hypothetical protein